MKKLLLFVLTFVFVGCFINQAKSQAFIEGRSYVQASYGIGNFMQSVFKLYEEDYDDVTIKIMGPMFLKYEFAVSEKAGIGLNIAYASANLNYKDNDYITASGDVFEEELNWATYSFLVRYNMHFGNHDIVDPYWGVGMGYRIATWKYTNNDDSYEHSITNNFFPLGFETTFGCRFMFAESFGAFAEVGLAKAIFQVGLAGSF